MPSQVQPIHPVTEKFFAESPYLRKLQRIREDVSMARLIAGDDHKDKLAEIIAELNLMIGNR